MPTRRFPDASSERTLSAGQGGSKRPRLCPRVPPREVLRLRRSGRHRDRTRRRQPDPHGELHPPDESEKAKAALKRKGQHRLIDKVEVRLVASEDKFWAQLSNFGDKYVHIPEDLVYKYERLLQGGVWCQLELVYNADDDEAQKRPFYIAGLKPIQVAAFDLDAYMKAGRASPGTSGSISHALHRPRATQYDLRGKLLAIRLVPMVERNYNLIELGPWGTGKSFVYRETSPNAILISGGKITVPQLFVHLEHRTSRARRNMGRRRIRRGRRASDLGHDGRQDPQGLHGVGVVRSRQGRDSCRGVIVFIGNTTKPPRNSSVRLISSPICRGHGRPGVLGPVPLTTCRAGRRRSWRSGSSQTTTGSSPTTSQRRSENFGSRATRAIDEDFALGAHLTAETRRPYERRCRAC